MDDDTGVLVILGHPKAYGRADLEWLARELPKVAPCREVIVRP